MHSAAIGHLRMMASITGLLLALMLMALLVFGQEAQQNNTWYSRSSPPYTFFLLNDDMELNRNR